MISLRHLAAALLALTLSARAITITEPPDQANTGPGTLYTLEKGVNTISGTLNTSNDSQDRFQVAVPDGTKLVAVSKTTSGGEFGGGFVSFNNQSLNGLGGGSYSGLPLGVGTYPVLISTNFTKGTNWSLTFTVLETPVIGVETFDYPDGPLAGKSGGTNWDYKNTTPTAYTGVKSNWDNPSGGATNVSGGKLVTGGDGWAKREYNGQNENDGAVNDFNAAKSVFYRVTVTTGATLPGYFGFASYDFGNERMFLGKRSGSGTFGYEIVGGASANGPIAVPVNTTFTLVMRLDFAGDGISLFLNPRLDLPMTDPANTAAGTMVANAAYTGSNWSTALRLASGPGFEPITWDNLVVATRWEALGDTIVTTLADEDDGPASLSNLADISLREAVKYSPTGLITFAPALSGGTITITHSAGDMEIPGAVTIDASALPGGLTVSGNNAHRHFYLNTGKSLTLRGLTLTGGNGTGAGANANGFGGAISNEGGALTLTQCTLSGNSASSLGGAILNQGTLTLTHCTLTGNSAASDGAINNGGTLSLAQCTVSGNFASNSGGAISNTGTVTLNNSIVARNGAINGADIANFGTVTRVGANIVQSHVNDGPGNDSGPAASTADPKLPPLGYFGGPVQTMHPLVGSPAIDAAGTTNPGGTDARGFPRFVDGNTASSGAQLDIGAVEAGFALLVSSAIDSNATGTLRSRLANAAILGEPCVRIVFDPAVFPASSITLNGNQLTPPAGVPIFIDASNLTAPVAISGNNLSRVFNIPATATVAMHSLKIVNGRAPDAANSEETSNGEPGGHGGGILNAGSLSLFSSTVGNNRSGRGGRAIRGGGGGSGGGIYSSGPLSLTACTIHGNTAGGGGDGTFDPGGQGGYGGGVASSGPLSLTFCTVSANTAADGGSSFTLVGSGGSGGGIYKEDQTPYRLSHCTFAGNRCGGFVFLGGTGAGIFGGRPMLQNCLLTNHREPDGSIIDLRADFVTLEANNLLSAAHSSSGIGPAPAINPNPLLAPLGDYGGPTQTMPPLRGSPAIDAAPSSIAQTDQRGAVRTRDGDGNGTATPDIGAVEASLVFVTTTGDTGTGSLRAALTEAAAQPGADTVYFTAAVTPHITLASEILITDPAGVTIDGSDRPTGVVIDGGPGTNRHFRIEAGTTAIFQRLRLYGGGGVGSGTPLNYGGSIYNSGSLTLRECTLADNTSSNAAGAVYNQSGALTVERSTFYGNTSGSSGAILHESLTPMIITASTFTGNVGRFEGGAITLGGFRPATLTHCTIAGNAVTQTGGGGSGGIRAGNPGNAASNLLTLRDSIIAGNTDANLPGVPNVNPGFIAQGNNLTSGNPNLAALGNYGGPTWTMPPMSGSPAIDGALSSITAQTDQRGAPRLVDGNLDMNDFSDIGAVESPAPLTVTTAADQNDTPAGPQLSLREAIRDAAAGATILFAPAFNGESADTIVLGSEIAFTKGLIINASANPGGVTIDGGPGKNRIFRVPGGTGAFLQRLTLTGGNGGDDDGGAISNSGTLGLLECTFVGNTSPFSGGAIESIGTLRLDACTMTGNSACCGGAIFSRTAGLTEPATSSSALHNCTLTGNTAAETGGGIYNSIGHTTLLHCTLTGNTAPAGKGSAVSSYGDDRTRTTVQNCLIAGNANASDVSFVGQAPLTNTFLSLGGNLIGNGNATGAFNQLRDGIGATAATVRLALLSDFGGPTETIALRPGSPALGNAVASVTLIPITTDQRGFPAVGLKDSGAYEAGNNLLTSYNSWIWETLSHTASENDAVSNTDFDRDGQTNEAEWLAQTNPGNPASVLSATGFIFGQFFVVEFPTVTGRRYTLQFSDDLQSGSWFDLTELTGANNVQSFTVPRQQPRRFFRVKISR